MTSSTTLPVLTPANASRWFLDAKATLGRKRVAYVLDENSHAPGLSSPPTTEELNKRQLWRTDSDVACSLLWEALSDEQKSKETVRQAYENGDAKGMWAALRRLSRPINIASRYIIFVDLIRLSMRPAETLEAFLNRVRAVTAEWRSLWPTNFTTDQLLTELALGAFLSGLSVERQPWSSAVLVQLKQNTTLDALEALVRVEDSNQTTFGNPAIKAMAARIAPAKAKPNQTAPAIRVTREEALAALHAALGLRQCFVCDGSHRTDKCSYIDAARSAAIAARRAYNEEHNGPRRPANAATVTASIVEVPEASVRHFVYSTLASLAARPSALTDWNTDTGCSAHMTPHRAWFVRYTPLRVPIELADHSIIYSAGIGSVEFRPSLGGREQPYTLCFQDVLHVPSLAVNLLSVYSLTTKSEYTVTARGFCVRFHVGNRLRMTATVTEQLTGYLNGRTVLAPDPIPRALRAVVPKHSPLTPDLWHRRFGHLDPSTIRRMHATGAVVGLKFERTPPDALCEPCLVGKQKRKPISRAPRPPAKEPLGEVHWDLKGPFPRSRNGFLYWAIGVDSATRLKYLAFLKRKLGFHQALVEFVENAETQTGRRYKVHWHDKGGEFIGQQSIDYCRDKGIEIRETETASPWQNGLAERANGVVRDHVVAMLEEAGLPPSWWPFAASCFVYAYNRSPSGNSEATPFELWYGEKPDVSLMRVFGCLAYAVRWVERRDGTLGSHTRKSIFAGYSSKKVGSWLFYDLESRDMFECSTAVFVEDVFPGLTTFTGDIPNYEILFTSDEPKADTPPQSLDDSDDDEPSEALDNAPVSSRLRHRPAESPPVRPPVQNPSPAAASPAPAAGSLPMEPPTRAPTPPAAQTAPAPTALIIPPRPRSELVQRTERPHAPVPAEVPRW